MEKTIDKEVPIAAPKIPNLVIKKKLRTIFIRTLNKLI